VRQTRRVFLRSAAAATAGTLLLPGATGLTRAQGLARGGRFTQSVASGQPSPNGITLWTKVDGLERTSRLQVEIARDEGFANVVYRQDVLADAESGFAVHHRAEHPVLRPGEPFFYRFYTCDENSPVGRFRTAVPADSRDPIRIGFFSCQAFEAGFYTAHEGLLNEPDLDLVVCLGDYVYERIFYGEGGVRADRTGVNRDGDVQSLAEYREKYALYHTDQRLLELRRRATARGSSTCRASAWWASPTGPTAASRWARTPRCSCSTSASTATTSRATTSSSCRAPTPRRRAARTWAPRRRSGSRRRWPTRARRGRSSATRR
jgi:phosphodiesterase/alkaline phosphatase D-like protein